MPYILLKKMCGIYFCYHRGHGQPKINHTMLQRRGPDMTRAIHNEKYTALFYRLAIVGVADGMQPFESDDCILLCNGEIYNHVRLAKESRELDYEATEKIEIIDVDPKDMMPKDVEIKNVDSSDVEIKDVDPSDVEAKDFKSTYKSDCGCIIPLYKKYGIEKTVRMLDGEFAFILYDIRQQVIYFARDRFGRKPLFYNCFIDEQDKNKIESIEISSLYSGLSCGNANEVNSKDVVNESKTSKTNKTKNLQQSQQVLPGQLYTYDIKGKSMSMQPYHVFMYNPSFAICDIYYALEKAIHKRITQTERPVGFLLSGGFDSSLVLSIALNSGLLKKPPHVFTIGFEEKASDVLAASTMVDWIKSRYGEDSIVWHKVILPLEDGLKRIPEVIQALETYDTTTIRASTPMYLISEYIAKNTDVKVVLSGEGADELFGGYMYFKYAPNDVAFRAEIVTLLQNLYLYDVLRADRSTAAHGLEVRPPFLDDLLVDVVLSDKNLKGSKTTTKELIRTIVADKNLLPDNILWGKKEAFSDAVGLSWKESIEPYAHLELCKIDDKLYLTSIGKDLDYRNRKICHIRPYTREAGYFQHWFNEFYPNAWDLLPKLWLPNQSWVNTGSEPSARVLDVYKTQDKK